MRKLILFAVGLVALATAGIAVAHGIEGAKSAKAVAGTFGATTASKTETRSCTTTDGKTIEVIRGRWTGIAAGDADLAGPITIEARSTINTTDGIGVVEGKLRIDVSGGDTRAAFSAVYDHGKLAGLAAGKAHDPYARLLANLSADYAGAGGFANGKLGGGTAGGSAIELSPGRCSSQKPKAEKSEARGTVTAVSSSSITVAGLTCAVPQELVSKVSGLKVNDRAEIRCSLVNGTNTLQKVEKKH